MGWVQVTGGRRARRSVFTIVNTIRDSIHYLSSARQHVRSRHPTSSAIAMSFESAVRDRRRALGLTLQQLAARSGVSAAMLSEVERGRKSPTLRVAAQIADGLELAVSELLDGEPAPRMHVRRRAERRRLVDRHSAIERHLLAPALLANGIEVVWYVVPPASESGTFAPQQHGALSHATVVRGTAEFDAEGQRIVLKAGDSIEFPGNIEHEFRNPGRTACEFLLVVDRRGR